MDLISRKNELMVLAAFVVVILIVMGFSIYRSNSPLPQGDGQTTKLTSQSNSTEIAEIEKDVMDTDLEDLDQELLEIEAELDQAY